MLTPPARRSCRRKKIPTLPNSRAQDRPRLGNLMSLLTLLKGLPMTYNRDLQENKERLFDTADTVRATTRLMAAMLSHTLVNKLACATAAADPALLATDLADYLVRKHAVPAGASCGGRGGGAGGKNLQAADGLTLAQLQEIDKPLAATRWAYST